MRRALIVGGGTGGTMLANRLDKRRFEITVLSASREHMFQPDLLYIAFTNLQRNIIRDERRLLASHVRFVPEKVARADLQSRVVETAAGNRYEYDYLVLATGAHTVPLQIPGLSEVSSRFGDYHSGVAQAKKLWASLDAFRGGTIALGQSSPICVCPPSPVEGILLTDRLLRQRGLREKSRLVFFTPYPRAYPAEPINEIIEPIVKERGIEIMTIFDVDRIDPAERKIYSIEGDTIAYDLPIIIPPFAGAEIAYEPADVVDVDRFLITDKQTLQVKGFDSVYAIGDGTNIPVSKAGIEAHLESKVVANRLSGGAEMFDGRTNCPVDLADGRGTFVIGSFTAPVQKYPPSRLSRLMKAMFGRFYWLSLRGIFNPIFDSYFIFTKPRPRPAHKNSGSQPS
jgi:sulfide:quinone oxidoreductase